MPKKCTVSDKASFADLALERELETRRLLFASAPLAEVCRASDLDPDATLADEDLVCWLICEWYLAHRMAGGETDPAAEAILAKVAELEATGIAVLLPGSAFPN
jgi:hypothetical protein